jgi:hypothetical protein
MRRALGCRVNRAETQPSKKTLRLCAAEHGCAKCPRPLSMLQMRLSTCCTPASSLPSESSFPVFLKPTHAPANTHTHTQTGKRNERLHAGGDSSKCGDRQSAHQNLQCRTPNAGLTEWFHNGATTLGFR